MQEPITRGILPLRIDPALPLLILAGGLVQAMQESAQLDRLREERRRHEHDLKHERRQAAARLRAFQATLDAQVRLERARVKRFEAAMNAVATASHAEAIGPALELARQILAEQVVVRVPDAGGS